MAQATATRCRGGHQRRDHAGTGSKMICWGHVGFGACRCHQFQGASDGD